MGNGWQAFSIQRSTTDRPGETQNGSPTSECNVVGTAPASLSRGAWRDSTRGQLQYGPPPPGRTEQDLPGQPGSEWGWRRRQVCGGTGATVEGKPGAHHQVGTSVRDGPGRRCRRRTEVNLESCPLNLPQSFFFQTSLRQKLSLFENVWFANDNLTTHFPDHSSVSVCIFPSSSVAPTHLLTTQVLSESCSGCMPPPP